MEGGRENMVRERSLFGGKIGEKRVRNTKVGIDSTRWSFSRAIAGGKIRVSKCRRLRDR